MTEWLASKIDKFLEWYFGSTALMIALILILIFALTYECSTNYVTTYELNKNNKTITADFEWIKQ